MHGKRRKSSPPFGKEYQWGPDGREKHRRDSFLPRRTAVSENRIKSFPSYLILIAPSASGFDKTGAPPARRRCAERPDRKGKDSL